MLLSFIKPSFHLLYVRVMYIHFLTRSLDPAGTQLAVTIGLRVSVVVDLSFG